jgi:hypothetical protein
LCSNIQENIFAVGDTALLFLSKSADSLRQQIEYALNSSSRLENLAVLAKERARSLFSWELNYLSTFEKIWNVLPRDIEQYWRNKYAYSIS